MLQDALPPLDDAEPPPVPAAAVVNGNGADPFHSTHAFLAALDSNAPLSGAMLVVEIDDFDAMQVELGLLRSESLVDATRRRADGRTGRRASGAHRESPVCRRRHRQRGRRRRAGRTAARNDRRCACSKSTAKPCAARSRSAPPRSANRAQPRDAMNLAFKTLVAARAANKTNCIQWPSVTALEAEGNTNGLSGEQKRILKLVNDAIENQTFVLLFQPIISLRGDSDEHYEVFLRSRRRERPTPAARPVPRARDRERRCRQDRSLGDSAVDQGVVGASLERPQHATDDQPDAQQPDRRRVHSVARRRDQGSAPAERRGDLPDRRARRGRPRAPGARVRAGSEGDALPHVAAPLRRNRQSVRNAAPRAGGLREDRRQPRAGARRRSGRRRTNSRR